jgi:2,5-dihydroxypyridine 5,6-dioxygenase
VVYVSNEHPEALVRLLPDDTTEPLVKDHIKRLRGAKAMPSPRRPAPTCSISLQGAVVGGNWGTTTRPGTHDALAGRHGAGLPGGGQRQRHAGAGPGDVNLTFKRYIERPITLTIENDYVTRIDGSGVDAELMRSYIAAWGRPERPRGLCASATWATA